MARARVVVVGSSNTDMVVRTARIPAPGETVLGGEFVMVAGGKGANQAVAAARLGAEVALVARVGVDVFGDRAVEGFAAAGIATDWVARDAEAPSGTALIFVEESGQNSIVVAPGANARLSPADVEAARPALEAADLIVLQLEIPLNTVACAIALGRTLGKRVILNPAPVPSAPIPLDGIDLLIPNEVEAGMLLGRGAVDASGAPAAASELRARGIGTTVVTLGAAGVYYAAAGGEGTVPARSVRAVDTTAAGDCFTGALACALGEGMPIAAAIAFANAAAALSVTRLGAQTSMPTRAEVEAFL